MEYKDIRLSQLEGKTYQASWACRSILASGDRVQIIHDDDGSYSLEPIPD